MAAEFYANIGGVRKAKEVYFNHAGTIRKAKEIWYNDNGTMRLVYRAEYQEFESNFSTGGVQQNVTSRNYLWGYRRGGSGSISRTTFKILNESNNSR